MIDILINRSKLLCASLFWTLLLFLGLEVSCFGQQRPMTERLRLIDSFYTVGDYKQAKSAIASLILLAQDSSSVIVESHALYYLAKVHQNTFQFFKAIDQYQNFKECRVQGKFSYDSFYYHRNMAICYASEAMTTIAINHYDSARVYLDKNNYYACGEYYGSMAYFFGMNDHDAVALRLTNRSLDYFKKLENRKQIMHYQYDMAFYLKKMGKHEASINHLDTVILLASELKDTASLWMGKACMGINEVALGRFKKGVSSLEFAKSISTINNQTLCCANDAYTALGYAKLGLFEKVTKPLEIALDQLPEVTSVIDLYNVYEALSTIYEILGNNKEALFYFKAFKTLKDTIANINYNKIVAEQEAELKYHDLLYKSSKLDTDKKTQILKNNALERFLIVGMFVLIIVLFFAIFYYLKTQSYKYDQALWKSTFEPKERLVDNEDPSIKAQFFQNSEWINDLKTVVLQHISNEEFKSNSLSQILGMSSYELNKKINAILDMTSNKFIRTVRIERGKELLISGEYNISEVAYEVGFGDPAYFSRVFKAATGISPKHWKDLECIKENGTTVN